MLILYVNFSAQISVWQRQIFLLVLEKTPESTKADASVKLMKTISVGHGGIWAVNAKDDRSVILTKTIVLIQ